MAVAGVVVGCVVAGDVVPEGVVLPVTVVPPLVVVVVACWQDTNTTETTISTATQIQLSFLIILCSPFFCFYLLQNL
jgi:hypothetical protein